MLQRATTYSADTNIETAPVDRGMRTDTLLWLQWLMVVGQLFMVFGASVVLKIGLPILPCLVLICAATAMTIYLRFQSASKPRLSGRIVVLCLTFDILQFSALLFFTGGLTNPFVFQLLVPVVIAATSLRRSHTIFLGMLVVVTSSILVDFHYPLPWFGEETLELPTLYTIGVWCSLFMCLAIMCIYAVRVSNEAHNLSAALAATELVLAREQHLSALDGMAAAAAHELGTPLSTISVVARELQRELDQDSPMRADIDLLSSQAKRCRDILTKLTSLTPETESPMTVVKLSDMIEELADPHRNFGVSVEVSRHTSVAEDRDMPLLYRFPGVEYGLGNLVENAVDFANSTVMILLAWDEEVIIVNILDDGPGFSDQVADRLGEPYITSRQAGRPPKQTSVEGGGLGLGIFIAKTLLERSGASLDFRNRQGHQSGASVTVMWPRDLICIPEREPRDEHKNSVNAT
ncbi:MAG: ActS/PrrB/RegB family redox-sensitive histidine kinase [Pseudomonadota bacterium]